MLLTCLACIASFANFTGTWVMISTCFGRSVDLLQFHLTELIEDVLHTLPKKMIQLTESEWDPFEH